MGWIVAFSGQKGGAGKTTSATGFAVAAAKHGASVLIGDMDTKQQSSMQWGKRRRDNGHQPVVSVQVMVNEKAIELARDLFDVVVLDLPPHADDLTLKVAKASDLMVIVTDTNAIELEPTVNLLHALKAHGLEAPRIVIALSKVRDERREGEARAYLAKAGYQALKSPMMDYTSIHDIGNDGRSPPEITYPAVAEQAKAFFKGLMDALSRATEQVRESVVTKVKEGRGR